MIRRVRDTAGLAAAWTMMGMAIAGTTVAVVAIGTLYAIASAGFRTRTAAGRIAKRKTSKGKVQ